MDTFALVKLISLNFIFSDDYQARSEKLVLLDVGSCFNPFKTFSDIFIPLAIDLCPADQVSDLHDLCEYSPVKLANFVSEK